VADDQPVSLEEAVAAYDQARGRIDHAKAGVEEARAEAERKRQALAAAVVAEARGGARQVDIIRRTGLARETVRRYLRAAGITPDEEG
jgi:hypothetical protein